MKDKKIDLVYLWVDGNDKKWRAEKDKWLKITQQQKDVYNGAAVAARWRDNDELRYALRSAEKFAPWINHIYLVTGFGQVPDWLNTDHPKITVVDHSEIIPGDALPTFNSNSIEMCISNIPGLSEYFLLANDDTFFNAPIGPDFFFDARGRARVWHTRRHLLTQNFGIWLESLDGYNQTLALSTKLIKDIFNKDYTYLRPAHNIDPYIKSSMIAAKKHPLITGIINRQIYNKFRTNHELQRFIFNLFDLVHNRAIFKRARHIKNPKHILYNTIHWRKFKQSPMYCIDAIEARLNKMNPPLFCINDTGQTTEQTRRNNKKFLQSRFPNKSTMEL